MTARSFVTCSRQINVPRPTGTPADGTCFVSAKITSSASKGSSNRLAANDAMREAILTTAKSTRQHTSPMIIDRLELPGTAHALERMDFALGEHKEEGRVRWSLRRWYRYRPAPVTRLIEGISRPSRS